MYKVLIFGGTTEGRLLFQYCWENGIKAAAYVATPYGRDVLLQHMSLSEQEMVAVKCGCLDKEKIIGEITAMGAEVLIDATHPYAQEITQNCKAACLETKTDYIRILRKNPEEPDKNNVRLFDDTEDAVSFLNAQKGNILLTTGSRDLKKYTLLSDFANRLYIRVLPDVVVLEKCISLGIRGRHLCAMQGPFTEELNYGMIKEFNVKWLVTKASGEAGGFHEKLRASLRAGIQTVIIGRPEKETGISIEEARQILEAYR